MQTVNVNAGAIGLSSLISGEIQSVAGVAVMSTTSAATEYQIVRPTGTGAAATSWVTSEVALGTTGAIGDYLEGLEINNTDALNAAVYLEDGNLSPPVFIASVSGPSGTGPSGTTALACTATAAVTITAGQIVGYLVAFTYTPTTGAPTKMIRKITANAAMTATTAFACTVSHVVPAGGAIGAWELLPLSAYEVQPFNTPAGSRYIPMGRRSLNGGWKLSVDAAVQVVASGLFI